MRGNFAMANAQLFPLPDVSFCKDVFCASVRARRAIGGAPSSVWIAAMIEKRVERIDCPHLPAVGCRVLFLIVDDAGPDGL